MRPANILQPVGVILSYDFTVLPLGSASLPSLLNFTRASAATVQTGLSTVVSSGIGNNVARIGWDGVHGLQGLVIEETRTNSIPDSRDLTTGNWLVGGTNTSPGVYGVAGPDGAASKATRVTSTNGGVGTYRQGIQIPTGQKWTLSAWEKLGSGAASSSSLAVNQGTSVSTGQVLTTAWVRDILVATGDNTANSNYIFEDGRNLGGPAAGARDVAVDLVQWEQGAFQTEAIVSTGGAASRSGERLYHSNVNRWINNGAITLEYKFIPKGKLTDYPNPMYLWNVDANNYAFITGSTGTISTSVGGVKNTLTNISWSQFDTVQLTLGIGGGTNTIGKYSLNGGATLALVASGAALGSMAALTGTLDLLCQGTSNQLTCWSQIIRAYTSGSTPSWAQIPWTPGSLGSALIAWYRADNVILNGSNVSASLDKSGNNYHISASVAANQPLYVASGLNGQPTMRFNGTSHVLQNVVSSMPLTQPMRYFFVFKMVSVGATGVNDGIFDGATAGSVTWAADTTPRSYMYAGTNLSTGSVIANGSFAQVNLLFNGASSVIRSSRVNNATGNAGAQNTTGLTLGALGGANPTRFTNVEFAELFIVNRDVTATELSNIESYFSSRYGVT